MLHHCYRKCCSVVTKNAALEITENAAFLITVHNKKVIRLLKRHNVLLSAEEKDGIKLFINDQHKEDVVRFVKDGTISKIISNLIKAFSK